MIDIYRRHLHSILTLLVFSVSLGLTAPAEAAQAFHTCKSIDVGTFNNRVHVRCDKGVGAVVFFAAPTANSAHAARILAVLLAAHSGDNRMRILYDTASSSGVGFGCAAHDCRRILAVSVLQ